MCVPNKVTIIAEGGVTHNGSVAMAEEMIAVAADADQVSCDGGGGPLGHPLVYYTFDGKDTVECGYCDRQFTRKAR